MLAIVLPLLLATGGSLLAAGIALGCRSTAGRVPFAWLMLAIALAKVARRKLAHRSEGLQG